MRCASSPSPSSCRSSRSPAESSFPSPASLKSRDGEEEERRLFYVAVTRAKDELYLCHPIFRLERDQTRTILRPSRFVAELEVPGPSPVFERWAIEEAPFSGAPQLDVPEPPPAGPLPPPPGVDELPSNVTPLFGPRR